MDVPRMFRRKISKESLALCTGTERQPHLNVRSFHPTGFVIGKALHHAGKERIGWFKTRLQEMLQTVLNLAGEEGMQHGRLWKMEGNHSFR